jgi:hypothetical protein
VEGGSSSGYTCGSANGSTSSTSEDDEVFSESTKILPFEHSLGMDEEVGAWCDGLMHDARTPPGGQPDSVAFGGKACSPCIAHAQPLDTMVGLSFRNEDWITTSGLGDIIVGTRFWNSNGVQLYLAYHKDDVAHKMALKVINITRERKDSVSAPSAAGGWLE